MRRLFAVLLLVFLTAPALALAACPNAGFCFVGSEPVNFLPYYGASQPILFPPSVGNDRPAYAQSGDIYNGCNPSICGNTAGFMPQSGLLTPIFPGQSAVSLHFQFVAGTPATSLNNVMLAILDSGGAVRVALVGSGTNNQINIATQSGGTLTTRATCPLPTQLTQLAQYDLTLTYSTTGSAALYQNASSVCSFSGDTTAGAGTTTVNQVALIGSPLGNGGIHWSEIVVADGTQNTLGLVGVLDLNPLGAGATQTWTGTASSLSASNAGDCCFISTTASNQYSLWWYLTSLPGGSVSIPVVIATMRSMVGTTGPQHLAYAVQPSGASSPYTSPPFSPLNAFSLATPYGWTANPYSGGPWVAADFSSSLSFGVESLP